MTAKNVQTSRANMATEHKVDVLPHILVPSKHSACELTVLWRLAALSGDGKKPIEWDAFATEVAHSQTSGWHEHHESIPDGRHHLRSDVLHEMARQVLWHLGECSKQHSWYQECTQDDSCGFVDHHKCALRLPFRTEDRFAGGPLRSLHCADNSQHPCCIDPVHPLQRLGILVFNACGCSTQKFRTGVCFSREGHEKSRVQS
mmetsp:Transcript_40344/g.67025  ORF Transcript_40344/g.67025 Transcript_40344/m.67025 type:complete len:202 (-) Transcript_40344:123-728(-)